MSGKEEMEEGEIVKWWLRPQEGSHPLDPLPQ